MYVCGKNDWVDKATPSSWTGTVKLFAAPSSRALTYCRVLTYCCATRQHRARSALWNALLRWRLGAVMMRGEEGRGGWAIRSESATPETELSELRKGASSESATPETEMSELRKGASSGGAGEAEGGGEREEKGGQREGVGESRKSSGSSRGGVRGSVLCVDGGQGGKVSAQVWCTRVDNKRSGDVEHRCLTKAKEI